MTARLAPLAVVAVFYLGLAVYAARRAPLRDCLLTYAVLVVVFTAVAFAVLVAP